MNLSERKTAITFLTFLLSATVLILCTLPVLVMILAGEDTVQSMLDTFPFLSVISHYKLRIFIVTGIILGANAGLLWARIGNNELQGYSKPTSKITKIICSFSIGILIVAIFFSYVLPYILYH